MPSAKPFKLEPGFRPRVHHAGGPMPLPVLPSPLQTHAYFSPPLEVPCSRKLARGFKRKVEGKTVPVLAPEDASENIEGSVIATLRAVLCDYFGNDHDYQAHMEIEIGVFRKPTSSSEDHRIVFTREGCGHYESALEVYVHSDDWLLLSEREGKVSRPTIDRCSIKGYVYLHQELEFVGPNEGGAGETYAAVIDSLLTGEKIKRVKVDGDNRVIRVGDYSRVLQRYPHAQIHNPTLKRMSAATRAVREITSFCGEHRGELKVAAQLIHSAYLLSEIYCQELEEAYTRVEEVHLRARQLAPSLPLMGGMREVQDRFYQEAREKLEAANRLLQPLGASFPRGLLLYTTFS